MRLLSVLIALFLGLSLHAQSEAVANVAPEDINLRAATDALALKYSLSADQAKQVYTIQQRKQKNMAEIAALQNSDIALYQAKLLNVQKGTWISIRRVLKSKEQVAIYQKTQAEIRGQRNAKRKALAAQNAPKETVEAAVLAIYAE